MTDVAGNYFFSKLAAGGSYTITPLSPDLKFDPPIRVFNKLSKDEEADFAGSPVKVITYKISGHVKYLNGAFPTIVQVKLAGGKKTDVTRTNVDGSYSFSGLPAGGTYTIAPLSPDMKFDPPSRVINQLSKDEQADFAGSFRGIDHPPVFYKISGHVAYQPGPVPIVIQIKLEGEKKTEVKKIGPDGRYVFSGLVPGKYTVTPAGDRMIFKPRSWTGNLEKDVTIDFLGTIERLKNPGVIDPKLTPVLVPRPRHEPGSKPR